MATEWYCQLGGVQLLGPVSQDELLRLAENDRLVPTDPVRKGTEGDWIIAGNVPGLFRDKVNRRMLSTRESLGSRRLIREMRGEQMAEVAPSENPRARLSLVLGLLSLVLSALAGVPAIIVGIMALGDINSSEGALGGRRSAVTGIILGALGTIPAFWLVPILLALLPGRQAEHRAECADHLHEIVLALAAYHDAHGEFPPAYVADAQGRPLHSWRVLLLPFLGETPQEILQNKQLHSQYRLDEPWNGPHNALLADKMPELYGCRIDSGSRAGQTSFVAVVGDETPWPGADSTYQRQLQRGDGLANTVMLVERSDSGISWLEPRDIRFAELTAKDEDGLVKGLRSRHAGGAHVVMASGTVHFLPADFDPAELKALLTIAGGEKVKL